MSFFTYATAVISVFLPLTVWQFGLVSLRSLVLTPKLILINITMWILMVFNLMHKEPKMVTLCALA